MSNGISNTGDHAEARFRELTGASKTVRAADGDAQIGGSNVEVKKASSNTLNQVRAVKFIPLVAFDTRDSAWFVIPAPEIIRLVVEKERGQHTENPFESATLSLANLQPFRVEESQLKSAVLTAIEEGKKKPLLKAAMDEILKESRDLSTKSRAKVRALLLENE